MEDKKLPDWVLEDIKNENGKYLEPTEMQKQKWNFPIGAPGIIEEEIADENPPEKSE